MFRFKIAMVAVLFTGLPILAAGAEETVNAGEAVSGTALQHHTWSRKFYTAPDPDVTGAIAPPVTTNTGVMTTTFASQMECVPSGLGFSNPLLPHWRIDAC